MKCPILTANAEKGTPKSATATFAYHQAATAMAVIETYLNHTDKAAEYQTLAEQIREGYHAQYFNATHYCSNTQACNALALDIGAVPTAHKPAVLSALIASLEDQDWHWAVGEIALPCTCSLPSRAQTHIPHSTDSRPQSRSPQRHPIQTLLSDYNPQLRRTSRARINQSMGALGCTDHGRKL